MPDTPPASADPAARLLRDAEQEKMDKEDAEVRRKVLTELVEPFARLCKKKPDYKDMETEKVAYAFYMLQPKGQRPTQEQMARVLGRDPATLWRWRHDQDFIDFRYDLMLVVFREQTPDILANIAEAAQTSVAVANPVPAAKLWLQVIEQFKETHKVETDKPVAVFGFPASQFMKPEEEQKPRESVAEKHGKQLGEVLGKGAADCPVIPQIAPTYGDGQA
jgi:transcriptional regulator with XRE-family HTH domain